ncbi:protein-L-isoaspartate(D-aspartate) O-methyltransferase [Ancylobacter sp. A5.8]|uniref:protein-L-isoaspartate(D-aspartate) O-methyltransferase n=1 Tax=Ancylobacter gelatini TaxID=2919920 RepID=UPI001F4EDECA|nr:protein-L-isoaspartate(D-aspartate) O-methyltransferase [Ancylobacter gelatini]
MAAAKDDAVERAELLLSLRKRGIRDRLVMRAFEQVPRERFIEPPFRPLAWADQALPIDCGQSISQPSVLALATESLDLTPAHSVLEIGTGSGYYAAILGSIARHVVTVERFRTLVHASAVRLRQIGLANVEVVHGDGRLGHPSRAPYDRIVISAAVRDIPPALLAQLAPDGVLIAPIGPPDETQMLARFVPGVAGLVRRDLAPVRFVPLLPGVASVL